MSFAEMHRMVALNFTDAYLLFGQPAEASLVMEQLSYFSFVTLTSLGYGDLTPTIRSRARCRYLKPLSACSTRPRCWAGWCRWWGGAEAAATSHPAATHREHLANDASRRIDDKLGGNLRVLISRHRPAQRHLAHQPLIEGWLGLPLGRKVGRIVDQVLRNGVEPEVLLRRLDPRSTRPVELRAACCAVAGRALLATQRRGAADDDDAPAAARQELRQHGTRQPRLRVDHVREYMAPFGIVHIGYLCAGCRQRQVRDQHVDVTGLSHHTCG
jgi:hypothetical protein